MVSLPRKACTYILNIWHMMTQVNVHLAHRHIRLITHMYMLEDVIPKTLSMILFIKLLHQRGFAHETGLTDCL